MCGYIFLVWWWWKNVICRLTLKPSWVPALSSIQGFTTQLDPFTPFTQKIVAVCFMSHTWNKTFPSLWKIHFNSIHFAVEEQLIQSSFEVSTLNIPSIISITTLSPASVSPQVGVTYVTSYQAVKRKIQFSLESKHDLLNSKALFQKQIL